MKKMLFKILSVSLCFVAVFAMLPLTAPVVYAEEEDSYSPSRIIVSMGDSYSSGEGIDPFYGSDKWTEDKVKDEDWLAHRSQNSWSSMLTLKGRNGTVLMRDCKADPKATHWDDGEYLWFFVAASGAVSYNFLPNENEKNNMFSDDEYKSFYTGKKQPKTYNKSGLEGTEYLEAQLSVLQRLKNDGKHADYVTFTIGGNDVGFVDIIKTAAVPDGTAVDVVPWIMPWLMIPSALCNLVSPSAVALMINDTFKEFYQPGGTGDRLAETYKAVQTVAGKETEIIIAGYPTLLSDSGDGLLFSREDAYIINTAVHNFNQAIEARVRQCYSQGLNTHFVSVEEKFRGHEAYTGNPYINSIDLKAKDQDINNNDIVSAYSMHPNYDGARMYAECVQAKIDELEAKKIEKTKSYHSSEERDVVLVLDASGSMEGTPNDETKKAASKFVDTVLEKDVGIGIVTFASEAGVKAELSNSKSYLNSEISELYAYGGTNIDDGLVKAEEMLDGSNAKKKIIVLMTDGMPNNGRTGDDLVEYANTLKEKGIYVYTLGFFSSLSDSERKSAQELLEQIASDGCHYEIDDADKIVYFFDDIANQINGQKYIYIRIACPVDVTVSFDGETLCSKESKLSTRTDFGTLSFEENDESTGGTKDNRTKILRLKEGVAYDVSIEGNGNGKMNYTIGFMDEDGEYKDSRKFTNVKITKDTVIDTVADYTEKTVLKVDEDGDGKYDITYEAGVNGRGEMIDNSYVIYILAISAGLIVLSVIALVIRSKFRKRSLNKKAVKA